MRLKNKIAVIIGGGQAPGAREVIGNGRATALLFVCIQKRLSVANKVVQLYGNQKKSNIEYRTSRTW